MSTVFVVVSKGLFVRNLLTTGVADLLRQSRFNVVLLSPYHGQEEFKKAFGRFILEPLWPLSSRLLTFLINWRVYIALHQVPTATNRIKIESLKRARRRLGLLWLARYCARHSATIRLLEWATAHYPLDRRYGALFARYQPKLVISSTALSDYHDFHVLRLAHRLRIPTVSLVASWDNLTSKGVFAVRPRKLLVWNERNKLEAVRLHGYRPEDVYISGPPQFDFYARPELFSKRDAFFKRIGGNPQRRLLVYTTNSAARSTDEVEIIEMIARARDRGRFIEDCQLLVRVHPRGEPGLYERLHTWHGVIVERPQGFLGKAYEFSPHLEEVLHLANTLYHADVIINRYSTITIEAALFDKPVINICFDGLRQRDYWDSVVRFYDYDHFRAIVDSGGTRLAKSEEELIEWINRYLQQPALDSQQRRHLVQEQVYRTDGRAGERIAGIICRLVGEAGGQVGSTGREDNRLRRGEGPGGEDCTNQ